MSTGTATPALYIVVNIFLFRIGSGSGILTRNVLDHPLWSTDIAAIQAIEPNEGLRQICSDVVKDPRVTVRDGTFENTGVESGWADVILMASVRPSLSLVKGYPFCHSRHSIGV